MRAGLLRQRLAVQSVTRSQNNYGEPTDSWSTLTTIWGSVEPLQGRELFTARQVNPELTHKITVRYSTAITPDKRIAFGSRAFDINQVRNIDERNKTMELICKELVT